MRKGIIRIVLAYLILLGTLLAGIGLFVFVIWQVGKEHSHKTAEEASTILFAAMLVGGLVSLLCLAMIVRGKWLCLMSAARALSCEMADVRLHPVRGGGAGPQLRFRPRRGGQGAKYPHQQGQEDPTVLVQQIEELKKGAKALGPRTYTKLAGDFAGMLSTVFFVLFLRAVALCCNDRPRVIMAELYLLFTGALVAGVVYFFIDPVVFLKRPELLLGLAAGWLFSALWYFLLIVSTIVCIGNILSRPRSSLSSAH